MTVLELATKEQLCQMQDSKYRAFQSGLIPTVADHRIIGVRVPALRRLAREMTRDGRGVQYLQTCTLPHDTYDENNLHAYLIEGLSDYDVCMAELERFLPYVDNWATCDMMSPKILGTQPDRLLGKIRGWLLSDAEYTVRFGLVCLMRHFLGVHFTKEILPLAAAVSHDGYYVRMAAAWLFAEALTVRWDDAYPFILSDDLPLWTRKKAIQKALESRKITTEQKTVLRALREELSS